MWQHPAIKQVPCRLRCSLGRRNPAPAIHHDPVDHVGCTANVRHLSSGFRMMPRVLPFVSLALALLTFSACKQLDVTTPSSDERVLAGVVTTSSRDELPADAEVTVRVLDVSRGDSQPQILGEQTMKRPAVGPVSFRIEYRADETMLLRGVSADARVSIGGKLRYSTRAADPVTLGNFSERHVLVVSPTTQP